MIFEATTANIKVTVKTCYLEERSSPKDHQYVWAYFIDVANDNDQPVQLIRRYWDIADGLGNRHKVEGEGVVGEQPWIEARDHFSYMSACPLTTDNGIMSGHYMMQFRDGEVIEVKIPAFILEINNGEEKLYS